MGSILPDHSSEDLGWRKLFQQTKGFACDALAGQSRRLGVVVLRNTRSLAVGTTAITAEEQLSLVPHDELARESRVA
jgi:hypothetical protein